MTHTCSVPVSDGTPYEILRAQELNAFLGPKGSTKAVDLVCDLHNTTANMGLCLISYSECDWISLHICRHLQVVVVFLIQEIQKVQLENNLHGLFPFSRSIKNNLFFHLLT